MNANWEVGNCGLYCGNWGLRSTLGDAQARGRVMSKQLQKSPATILIVAEAKKSVADLLLESNRSGGDRNATGLAKKETHAIGGWCEATKKTPRS